jgi:hypothetical protein
MPPKGRVHDRALLDALEELETEPFEGEAWRIVRKGRDPLQGSLAPGRWSPGDADVLYTSLEKEGSLAEIGYRLSLEPVWPSRIAHDLHRIAVSAGRIIRFPHRDALVPLGIDIGRYETFDYETTQALAAAINFLELDGFIAPGARYTAMNLMLFTKRLGDTALRIVSSEPVDWLAWRDRQKLRRR